MSRCRPYWALVSWLVAGLAACVGFFVAAIAGATSAAAAEVTYEFGAQPQGARAWLAGRGFEFSPDAENGSRARFSLDDRGLMIETLGKAEPIIARPGLSIAQPARLSVTWGVNRYPAGANWDTGANNEAIMVMVFFGNEKLPGGIFCAAKSLFYRLFSL